MSTSLFAIGQEIQDLADALDAAEESGAEQAPLLDAWFATLGAEKDKVDNYVALIRDRSLRAKALKDEADRFAALAKSADGLADRLRQRLLEHLDGRGLKTLETERYKVTVCANGGALPIRFVESIRPQDADVPEEFRRVVTTVSWNTDNVRRALDEGEILDFASFAERGKHLRVR